MRGVSLRTRDAVGPSRSTLRLAEAIVEKLTVLIDRFTYHEGERYPASMRTWEQGRETWYGISETTVRDMLFNCYGYWPRNAYAVREAVRLLTERARSQQAD